jgi:hypothetical protein
MNPYSFIDPVIDPNMFYGYQDELEHIVTKVSAQSSERLSFFVIGAWRMGKTSLLIQAERRLQLLGTEQSNDHRQILIPVYLDMLRLGEATQREFFGFAALMLSRYLVNNSSSLDLSRSIVAELEAVKTAIDPTAAFQDCLLNLIKAFQPQRLRIVLLIDEFGRIMRQATGETLKVTLRSLHIDRRLQHSLAYVITGSYYDLQEIRPAGSPLENILVLKKLHVFDKEQSLALIQEPTEGQLPPEVTRQVYLESGGHPFLLQYLMYVLCEQEDLSSLKVEDVYQATRRFLQERRDFELWWEKLEDIDRKVYEAFTGKSTQNSADELASMMLSVPSQMGDGRRIVIHKGMITKALDVLSTTGLIRQVTDDIWERAGELFARWSRQAIQRFG